MNRVSLSQPTAVLSHFLPTAQVQALVPLDLAGGWSGSQFWRITVADGENLCLRRWPAGHPSAERLRLIHHVLTQAAAQGIGFVPVPLSARTGESFVRHAGHLWELAPWMPGRADYREHPSRPRLAAALRAVARFHEASGRLGPPDNAAAPAVIERLELVEQLLGGLFERISAAVAGGLSPELDARATNLLALTRDRVALLRGPLAAAAQLRLPLQPAIRDVHHDHVLFTGDAVTGLIDFGALRIDTPLADVARLVGSLAGDDRPSRDFALAAYGELRPLSHGERELIDLLDQANVVLSGLNWLRWLYLDRRDMGPLARVLCRLDEIAARLK